MRPSGEAYNELFEVIDLDTARDNRKWLYRSCPEALLPVHMNVFFALTMTI